MLRTALLPASEPMALYESTAYKALVAVSRRSRYFDLLWIEISRNADWRKRLGVAMRLPELRRELAIEIASRFLDDRSKKVRLTAASKALQLNATELLAPLRARLHVERDAATLKQVKLSAEVIESPATVHEEYVYKRAQGVTFKWRTDGRFEGWSCTCPMRSGSVLSED